MVLNDSNRCEMLGKYIIANKSTVREAAKIFGISKSTVHKDITQKLKLVNNELYKEVFKIMQLNKSERHIRGGEATRVKFEIKRNGKL